jgi:GWxTD domain-containing protein
MLLFHSMPSWSQHGSDSDRLREGIEAFEAGRLADAIQQLEEADTENAEAQYYLARAHQALGNEVEATRAIHRAIRADEGNLLYREWQHRIGSRAFRPIQKAREREMLRDMLTLDPDNTYANTAVGAEQTLLYQHHRHRVRIPELTPFESPLEMSRESFRRLVVDVDDVPDSPRLPAATHPFDLEEWRKLGYTIVDLGMRADSAFTDASERLTKVLRLDPRYFEAYRPLMALYSAGEHPRAMAYWAGTMRQHFPEEPWSWLYAGYAAHRLDRPEEAASQFRRGLALLAPEERVVFDDVGRLLDPAGEEAAATDSTFTAIRFWATRDPRYLTEANERELEHYARLVYADLQYAEEKLELRGWDSDRGRVYVRYGPPTAMFYMSNSVSQCSGRLTSGQLNTISNFHIFEYAEYRFVFGNPGNFGESQNVAIPPLNEFPLYSPCADAFSSMRSTAADYDFVIKTRNTIRKTPEAYTYSPTGRKVAFPHVATAFKGEGGAADLYVTYGIPLLVGPREDDLRLGLDAGAFVVSDRDGRVAERRQHIETAPGTSAHLFANGALWIGTLPLSVSAGQHMLSVEFESASHGALGFERAALDVPDFEAPAFAISDLQLAYLVDESTGEGDSSPSTYERRGYRISPAPWGVFGLHQPMYIYLELYHLRRTAQGGTRYQIEALLVPKQAEGRWRQRFRQAFRRGEVGEGVAVRFDGSGSTTDDGQYFILDAGTQPPGTYVLAVRVTDLERGETVQRTQNVQLE